MLIVARLRLPLYFGVSREWPVLPEGDKQCLPAKACFPAMIGLVEPEERHRLCWYGRRTADLPEDLGSHTIIDGELAFCAHPMYWPIVRYEFDVRNCEDCDVFKARRTLRADGEA